MEIIGKEEIKGKGGGREKRGKLRENVLLLFNLLHSHQYLIK